VEFILVNTLKLVQVDLTNLCFVYSHVNEMTIEEINEVSGGWKPDPDLDKISERDLGWGFGSYPDFMHHDPSPWY
jgi:hypothetical protein